MAGGSPIGAINSAVSTSTIPGLGGLGTPGAAPTAPATVTSSSGAPKLLSSSPISISAADANASQIDASIRPFLTEGLRQAQQIFLNQTPTFYPGQTYVDPSQATRDAMAAQEQVARSASPSLAVGQEAYLQSASGLGQTAGGQFLQGNPYQEQMMQAATRPLQQAFTDQVLPGISSLYSKSGRLGSGSMEKALGTATEQYGRAMGDVTASLAGSQYQAERALQQQAQMGLANVASAAPSIYSQQYLPSQQLAQIGAQQEAIAAQPLQEAMTRYAYEQRLPYEQLSGYLSSVYGSPLGSYGTQAQQLPQSNSTVGALGGALAGGLGGYALGQVFPQVGGLGGGYAAPALGAVAGGLLGGNYF